MVGDSLHSLAQVVELADTPDSKSGPLGGAGSIPALGTHLLGEACDRFWPMRTRLVLLTVMGTALVAIFVLRRRAIERNAEQFHRRYG